MRVDSLRGTGGDDDDIKLPMMMELEWMKCRFCSGEKRANLKCGFRLRDAMNRSTACCFLQCVVSFHDY